MKKDEKLSILDIALLLIGAFFIVGACSQIKSDITATIGFLLIACACLFKPIKVFVTFPDELHNKKSFVIAISVITVLLSAVSYSAGTEDHSLGTNGDFKDASKKEKVKVIITDFSAMSEKDVKSWCEDNKIKCNIWGDYSDSIKKGDFISQSVEANEEAYEGDIITIYFSLGKEPTMGEKNAIKKAESYLSHMAFSRKSLINQLKYEGFTTEESTYAVDNIEVDWNEQAAKKAESYLSHSSFSRKGLIDQLKYEGFTQAQAEYGVTQNGY